MKYTSMLINAALIAQFLILPGPARAGGQFEPGTPYYFSSFEPAKKPWNPGQELNYEEVFKNYLFFEIIFSPSGKEISVNRYIQGNKADSEQYLLSPDGSLSKKPGSF